MGQCNSAFQNNSFYVKPGGKRVAEDKRQNKQLEENLRFVQQVPIFTRIDPADVPLIGESLVLKEWSAGEHVMTEGDVGNEFFLIKSGYAQVLKDGQHVAKLKPGDYFGEGALLQDQPRNATVRAPLDAVKPLKTLSITRSKFEELGVMHRVRFPRRHAVAADKSVVAKTQTPTPTGPTEKDDADVELILAALGKNQYLSEILSETQKQQMADKAWKLQVEPGTEVTKEGSLKGDRFYIIGEGNFVVKKSVSKKEMATSAEASVGEHELLGELVPGGSFGELALLYNAPRAATVEATTQSSLWVIDRVNFKQILKSQTQQRLKEYEKLLANVKLLDVLLREEREALCDCLVEIQYRQGENIIVEGDENGNTFYFLYAGTVGTYQKGSKVATLEADPTTGNCPFFGEKALLENTPRNATITVESETAAVLALDRETFESVLGPLSDIIQKQDVENRKSYVENKQQLSDDMPIKDTLKVLPTMKELKTIGLLGAGGFGAVTLEYHKKTNTAFALKQISKGYIVKMHLQDQIANERKILFMTSSPFITRCHTTYNSKNHIYFLLEVCRGGEIFAVYNRRRFHGSYPHATFYAACIVKAFQHLHARRIIYRDLKPENMLLSDDGYCKLTDMGLAKFVYGRTYTTCGTPDYFAPEIVQSSGHTNAVDWWTFGVLLYELLMGHPPFESIQEPMAKYRKIAQGINQCRFPSQRFTDSAMDLIKQVCHKDPSQRLPMRPGGVEKNLFKHRFFEYEKWERLERRQLRPPYKPKVKSVKDISNFNAHQDDIPPSIPYVDPGTGWDREFGEIIPRG